MAALLTVKHNIEVAHRLSLTPGKCENIHGHSMDIELCIRGEINEAGLLVPNPNSSNSNKTPLEFGELKTWLRGVLDGQLDHRLLLNNEDSLLEPSKVYAEEYGGAQATYPGLVRFPGDPTTENIAKWVYEQAYRQYVQIELQPVAGRSMMHVTVYETKVNSATYGDF